MYDWKPVQKLKELYKLPDGELGKRQLLIIYDYVLHKGVHSDKNSKGLSTYAFRRYDNYVLLSATRLSIVLGAIAGIVIRVVNSSGAFANSLELPFWIVLTAIVVILIFAINKGREWIKFDYDEMHTAIIQESNKDSKMRDDLKFAFHLKDIGVGG